MRTVFAAMVATLLSTSTLLAETVIMQSTTSTQNSGLLDAILPEFTRETGIGVHVVAVGTGQALKNARNGDGDIVLVHARELEDQFVAEGWGIERRDVMYNDFVIVGPDADPAHVQTARDAATAFQMIRDAQAVFVSRGDSSGTHFKEVNLWQSAGVDPLPNSGSWYLETGSGMGATLNVSVETDGYALTDRGTWISFGNKSDHRILFEGDVTLFNPYGIILVNPDRHPHVAAAGARALSDWLTSDAGQAAIAAYRVSGQQLFFPNAD